MSSPQSPNHGAATVKLYHLDVPANGETLSNLVKEILAECENSTVRVQLQFGTCLLLCRDEEERLLHRDNVTALEAVRTLINARWTE